MDVLGSAGGQVELNLNRTQFDEQRQVRALATGLRVNSAVDDPSGLAISETIHTRVLGLQQGVQNVQSASNLLDVADATLATVQQILSRVHSLIVEASSDLNSNSQLSSIQSEIDELLHEINKIAGDANFNGVNLLGGSLSTYGTQFNSQPTAVQVTPVGQSNGTDVYDANNTGHADPGPLVYAAPGTVMYTQPGSVQGFIQFEVVGYSSNPVDPIVGPLGAPGVYVKITQYSSDPNFHGANGAKEQISTTALLTNAGPDQGMGFPLVLGNADNSLNMLTFDIANLTQADVGTAIAFETYDASPAPPTGAHPLEVNSSGLEGGIVAISLPNVSTSSLGISTISVLAPDVVDWTNTDTGQGSNAAATADAEARVQNALDALSKARAMVGAQTVSLQEDANDSSTDVVNQIASESAIRDVDMGQAVTAFTRDEILAKVGQSVLAQMQSNAQLVIQLVGGATPGLRGLI